MTSSLNNNATGGRVASAFTNIPGATSPVTVAITSDQCFLSLKHD